jgi:hypothetical protein
MDETQLQSQDALTLLNDMVTNAPVRTWAKLIQQLAAISMASPGFRMSCKG